MGRRESRKTHTTSDSASSNLFPVYEAVKDALLALDVRVLCKEGLAELEQARESLSVFLAGA